MIVVFILVCFGTCITIMVFVDLNLSALVKF